jgi:hypothetical protein
LPKAPAKIETYELDKERLKEKIQKALAQKPNPKLPTCFGNRLTSKK